MARKAAKERSKAFQGKLRRQEKKFYFDATNYLNDYLYSGKVVYNKRFELYINKICDSLLAHKKDVRKKVNVYLVLSCEVNAFTNYDGSIFVTAGLISRLNTEAELAFVLCHEIIHYKLKHSLLSHIENFKIDVGIGNYKSTLGSKLLSKHNFSHKNEYEADLEGFKILRSSPFKLRAGLDVLTMLKSADDPLFMGKVDSSLFNFYKAQFPGKWFSDKDDSPKDTISFNDLFSTHPAQRKE